MKHKYIKEPKEVLAENRIDIAEAKQESMTNPFGIGLDALGQMAMQYGMSQGGMNSIAGINGADGEGGGGDAANAALMMLSKFALGGMPGTQIVEAEGGEVVTKANGQSVELEGNKHEQGGVNIMAELGDKIFSERLVGPDGKTMAEREKLRQKRLSKLEKLLEKRPGDSALKNTLRRTASANEMEEHSDLEAQEAAKKQMLELAGKDVIQKAAYGLNLDPEFLMKSMNALMSQNVGGQNIFGDDNLASETGDKTISTDSKVSEETSATDILPGEQEDGAMAGMSAGDVTGIAGNMFSSIAPLINTMNSRATDTPNENHYQGFGEDALAANDAAKDSAKEINDTLKSDITKSSQAAKRSGRIGARGINTQRAMDLATEQGAQDSQTKAANQFAQQMMSILRQQSQLENIQDQVVMSGEEQKDLRDRADKDAHYSNIGQNLASIGQGIQQTGKDLNAVKQNEIIQKMLNQLSKYGKFDKDYNIVAK
jgi:hypothetical protein